MTQNSASHGDGPDDELTATDVLNRIESELADTEKVELSDEEMVALDIWETSHHTQIVPHGQRRALFSTARDNVPVKWRVYDVAGVDGRERGDYLAVEVHNKQQGERYTRPYAIGLGQMETTAKMPDADKLAEYVGEETDARDVEMVGRDALEEIARELSRGAEEFDIALEGNIWAAAFDGSTLYIEPEVSRWEGFEHVFDDLGLSEDQRRAIKEAAGQWSRRPRHLDVNSTFSFAVEIQFE